MKTEDVVGLLNLFPTPGFHRLFSFSLNWGMVEIKEFFKPWIAVAKFFGKVVLWSGKVKYTIHLSKRTSELKRKFPALCSSKGSVVLEDTLTGSIPSSQSKGTLLSSGHQKVRHQHINTHLLWKPQKPGMK